MRIVKLAIAGSMFGALLTGQATAQVNTAGGQLRQPASVQRTAYDYENYLSFADQAAPGVASDSPSNQPTPAPGIVQPAPQANAPVPEVSRPTPAPQPPAAGFVDDEDERWTLPQPRFLRCRDITLGGWTEIGTTFNNWGTNYNGLVTFPDRAEQLLLNQQWLFLDKQVNNGGCGWGWGGHVDMVYGSDAFFTQAVGLETEWGQTDEYQVALPQFYVDVAYNDLTMRAGHFFSILGYEVVQAPQNFFYTHTYTHQYGEPFTHTGLLFMYKVNEQFSFSAGLHRGDDQFGPSYSLGSGEQVDHAGFLGGVKWTGPNKRLELAWSVSTSEKNEVEAYQQISSFVAAYRVTDNLKYVFQNDYGQVANSYVVGGDKASWYGISQYLLYDINKCWAAGVRGEWFSDRDGVRVAGLRPQNPIFGTPYAGDFYEISMGLNWKPHANFLFRPEIRYDWYDPSQGQNTFPFDNGTSSHQWLLGMDAIFTY